MIVVYTNKDSNNYFDRVYSEALGEESQIRTIRHAERQTLFILRGGARSHLTRPAAGRGTESGRGNGDPDSVCCKCNNNKA